MTLNKCRKMSIHIIERSLVRFCSKKDIRQRRILSAQGFKRKHIVSPSLLHSQLPFVPCGTSRCAFDLSRWRSKVIMSLVLNQCLTRVETTWTSHFQHLIQQALTRFLSRFYNFSGCQTITGRRTTRSICCQWDVGCERSWLPIRQWPISNVLLPVETDGMVS